MTTNKSQQCSVKSRNHACAGLVVCLCLLQLISGCAERKKTPVSWRGAGLSRPVVPPTVTAPKPRPLPEESVDPVPELQLELPPPPPLLAVHSAPARPRVAPTPAAENNAESKPEAPVIAPQMSDAEASADPADPRLSEETMELDMGAVLEGVATDGASTARAQSPSTRAAAA